ncbi:MAG: quinone-dependent dihydroorotate dehydrogenase [Spirochaetes bacterium]|nr:quinone-dependent dihydroorotate dehydrogenase [Spirochaetota bacterium]
MAQSLLHYFYNTAKPTLFCLNAERAHGIASLSMRMIAPLLASPPQAKIQPKILFDRKIYSPIGIAAGFDKFCHAPEYIRRLGFGFIESGSLTPLPQKGNAKPRLVRVVGAEALINKMGFNNPGFVRGWNTLRARLATAPADYQIALSLGKGKETPVERAADDYMHCLDLLRRDIMSEYLFYIAINVSSPNTPNLRALQKSRAIRALVEACVKISPRPVVVKFAPDFDSLKHYRASLAAALAGGAAGIVISNTTTNHALAEIPAALKNFGGGLSGKPLAARARTYLQETLKETRGKIPVISSGGVYSPTEAIRRLDLGADLVQVYTGFIYYGPDFARDFLAAANKTGRHYN